MSLTFTAARSDLYDILLQANIADLTVFSYTPSTATPGTVASIDWDATSNDLVSWVIPVRVFTRVVDVEQAQTVAALMVDALEAVFDLESVTATWTNSYLPDLGVLMTEWLVTMPRTDM